MNPSSIFSRWSLFCIAILLIAEIPLPNEVYAHGSMETPLSRIYNCRLENPENPKSEACRAAVAAGGTQALYDWNSVRQGSANGEHRAIIPDGQLCSGGSSTFRGLDLARNDWVTTPISADAAGNFEFIYHATAPHATRSMEFYVTRDGYDPTDSLAWSDLESQPFCTTTAVALQNQRYHMNCPLPQGKSGKHVIYHIWQRSDSPEAFYACIDVEFTGGSGTPVPWLELGQIRAQIDLVPNSEVTLRLFETDPETGNAIDVETHTLATDNATSDADAWPFHLAQTINADSSLVAAGVLQQDGDIQPIQDSQANRLYTQSDRSLQFEIEIRTPEPQDGVSPTATITTPQTTLTGPGTILFSGSQSTDPNNLPLSYQWQIISGEADITSPAAEETAVTFPALSSDQTVTIELIVSNGSHDNQTALAITHLAPTAPDYEYVYPNGRGAYVAGTVVLGSDNQLYQCRPWPYSGWCNIASDLYYAPGSGLAWQDAWTHLN